MDSNKVFLKRLQAGRASFFLTDLHVHSPASECFGKPSDDTHDVPDQNSNASGHFPGANPAVRHEAEAMATYLPESFYNELLQHRNATVEREGIQEGEDWAFVAITDHNVCNYAAALSKYAWTKERLRDNRFVILPGMELSVSFPVSGTTAGASAHVLLIFAPLTEPQHIHAAIREASRKHWDFGSDLTLDDLALFVKSIRHHSNYPAMCIAAHVGSDKGVREEAKNHILNYLEAEISRLEGVFANPETPDRDSIQQQLQECQQRHTDTEHVSLEVLHLLGLCGFDALQTRGPRDQTYYRRLHRFREDQGRSVSIICSDAHRVQDIFCYSDSEDTQKLIPFTKLSTPSTPIEPRTLFLELRDKGLRFGETRTTHITPKHVTMWLQGVEILTDAQEASSFWPFSTTDGVANVDTPATAGRFTVALTRNLNCAIGGRGSGKSALIEALAFVCDPVPFDDKANQKGKDWYDRARATLRGCRVRACWRLLDDPQPDLARRALFVSRYFDPAGKHPAPTFSDIADKELLPGSVPLPPVQMFRIHDIEEAAQPAKLRRLFDAICGTEVSELTEHIHQTLAELATKRGEMVSVAKEIGALTKENSPLRQYARRKREYDSVNREAIREQYQTVDGAEAAETLAVGIENDWQQLYSTFDLTANKEAVESFFVEALAKTIVPATETLDGQDEHNGQEAVSEETSDMKADTSDDGPAISFKPFCEPLAKAIECVDGSEEHPTTAQKRLVAALDTLDAECTRVASALATSITGIRVIHRDARDALASRGHPTGSAERQSKKVSFDAARADFTEYLQLWQQWDALETERLTLFEVLKGLCMKRTDIRKATAEAITQRLATDLDPAILRIRADAQPISDLTAYLSWFDGNVRWPRAQSKEKRFEELAKTLSPESLRKQLLSRKGCDLDAFVVDKPTVAEGRITLEDARTLLAGAIGIQPLETEAVCEEDSEFAESLPKEIREGLCTFPVKDNDSRELQVDGVLKLDEVVLDDLPVILFNDRPLETNLMKPLERLSPGQRCSAILPILLLNGTAPLIIDQPEDNLDNRLIRQVIVNVLASIKLRRQVIVATHNPNLPVLGDAEQVIVLRAVEDERCVMETQGVLDDETVVRSVTEVMEGGREAFQYRHAIYQKHWTGGADPK